MANKHPYFLKATHVSKSVISGNKAIEILRQVNLSMQQGDSVAILGASGAGKTTLLTLLAGLDTPTKGEIILADQTISALDEDQRALIRANYVGFIFQSFQLISTLTALENVMLSLEIQGKSTSFAKQEALHWLEILGLSERIYHYPSSLSGGEQQRVAIARAFVTKPQIIFGDEITGNLDQHTGEKIADLLFRINEQQKTTLLMVTHDLSLAQRCHQCWQLKDGELHPV
jgi:putative ABC transport system ATP-binding protein